MCITCSVKTASIRLHVSNKTRTNTAALSRKFLLLDCLRDLLLFHLLVVRKCVYFFISAPFLCSNNIKNEALYVLSSQNYLPRPQSNQNRNVIYGVCQKNEQKLPDHLIYYAKYDYRFTRHCPSVQLKFCYM